jgi:hypothetical protein
MKIKKRFFRGASLAALMFAIMPNYVGAQEELKFNEILELKKTEYENLNYSAEKTAKKIGKYTRYWQDRLNEDGTLGRMTRAFPERGIGEKSLDDGVFCTTDDAEWNCLGPFNYKNLHPHPQRTGYVQEIYAPVDSSYVIIGSERGGIWKKDEGSTIWRNVTDHTNIPIFQISSIEADPFDPDHIFVSCGGDDGHGQGILESNDAGENWSVLSTFTDDYCAAFPGENFCLGGNEQYIRVRKLIIDEHRSTPGNLFMYALTETSNTKTEIWESVDDGASWNIIGPTPNPLPTFSYWADIEVTDQADLLCSSMLANGVGAQFYRRDHITGLWTDLTLAVSNPIGPVTPTRVYITKPSGSKIFLLSDNPIRSIYESNDYGVTWNLLTTVTVTAGAGVKFEIEYSPLVDKIFVGGLNIRQIDPVSLAQSSINQGHLDVRDIYFVNRGGDLDIYFANDGGASLLDYNNGSIDYLNEDHLPILQFFDIGSAQTSEERYIGGSTHNNNHVFNNGDWQEIWAWGDGNGAIINYNDPDIAYVTSNQYVKRYNISTDVLSYVSGTGTYLGGINIVGAQVFLNPVDPNTMYYVNDKDISSGKNYLNIWYETCDTWINREVPYLKNPGEFASAKSDTSRMYLAEEASDFGISNLNRLLRSDDDGVTWTSKGSGMVYMPDGSAWLPLNEALIWKRITDIEVNPYNEDQLWISISGFLWDDEEDRVLQSNDGGDTWVEHSQGLPRYPVNSIIYIEGTNGLMFAGTESGIFYRDNSMEAWECFNEGMAYAQIMDLDFNYCRSELIAATYGRGIWKTEIPTDFSPLTYTTNTTIPLGTYKFNTDIVVEAPAVMTILGTVEMANDKRITVEPGATLIIDGGEVTNQCDLMWSGIFLGGNAALGQAPYGTIVDANQASLYIKNGGTVRHSKNGVITQAYDRGFDEGARIFADDAFFIDNRVDVEMLSYSTSNVSHFKNTDFLTTGPLPDAMYTDVHGRQLGTGTHVKLEGVNGVEFFHNRFMNSGTFDQDIRGVGISSFDSDLFVDGKCNAYDPWNCTDPELSFNNLSKGVVFNSSTGAHVLKVEENYFDNTVQGVTVNGGTNIVVDDNFFLDYHGSPELGGIDFMESWGVYLDGTFCATVSDNKFRDPSSHTDPLFYSRGVVCVNTSEFDTYVKRNVFEEGELIGIQAWLDNSMLQISCNDFYSDFGIMVTNGIGGCTSLVPSQGTADNPAGNRFFKACADNYSHIFFDGIDVLMPYIAPNYYETIWHYYNYTGVDVTPTCISNDLSYLACSNPSNPATGYVWNDAYADYEEGVCEPREGEPEGAERPLIELIEDRAVLLLEIEKMENIEEQHQLETMIDANWLRVDESGVILPGEKSMEVMALNFVIMQAKIEQQKRVQQLARDDNFGEILLLNQTNPNYSSSLIAISMAIHTNAELDADLILEMTNMTEMDDNYAILYDIIESIKEEGKTYHDLSPDQIAVLSELAKYPSGEGSKAAAILESIGLGIYNPQLDDFVMPLATETINLEELNDYVNIYPNPSNDLVYVDLKGEFEKVGVLVINAFGQQVFSDEDFTSREINVTDWAAGMYYIHLTMNGSTKMATFVVN